MKKGIFMFILGLYSCLSYTQVSQEAVIMETHKVNLEYSRFLEFQLGGLGLLDMTKFSSQSDIDSLNIRFCDVPSTSYNPQIVIIDVNKNSKFEYDSIDLVGFIGTRNLNKNLDFRKIKLAKSKQPIIIKTENQLFEVNISLYGKNIELIKKNTNEVQSFLSFPYELPNIDVQKLTKNATLNKANGKYTFVEFWGTWCKPCLELIPEIKSLRTEFVDKLNIVSIDYRDRDFERVKQYIIKYEMNWDHVIANKILMKEFGNPSYFPFGILFDPQGKLIEYGITPEDARKHLHKF